MRTAEELRAQYPSFLYQEAKWELTEEGLRLQFIYSLEPEFTFQPTLTILEVTEAHLSQLSKAEIDNYVFHIGLAEMFSYWKLAASPEVSVDAGPLDDSQKEWWQELLVKGMGEYFYVNNLDFTQPNFVNIAGFQHRAPHLQNEESFSRQAIVHPSQAKVLIPVGGGKDSVVTLELFKQLAPQQLGSFLVEPTQAAVDVAQTSGITPSIRVKRHLDPLLFELNTQGFLNGHVPISALFAFLSVFAAKLFGFTHVAVSNERSSNEGNVKFKNREVNHQHSKTYEFERTFQSYAAQYLPGAPLYFSFLRPLYELQIGQLFATLPECKSYYSLFRSCNRGQKTNSWCGECPKCLFAYTILYPFLSRDEVVAMFGQDLFQKAELLPVALALLGRDKAKPFECVGTQEETLAAFYLCAQKAHEQEPALPPLLAEVEKHVLAAEEDLADKPSLESRAHTILTSWNHQHVVPKAWADYLHSLVFSTSDI